MKAYTDLEQSKKLAEILPLESADMYYIHNIPYAIPYENRIDVAKPCWSLAALLSILPFHLVVNNRIYAFSMIKGLDKNGETYAIKYGIFNKTFYYRITEFYNNPIDACYEMIIYLHEVKML